MPGCFKLSNHGASAGSGLSGGAASLAHHGAAAASLWRVSETALHEQLFAQRFPAREQREAPTRMIVSRLERHSSRKVQSGQRRAIRIMLLDRFLKLSQGAIILPRGTLPQGAGLFLTTLCAVRSNEVGRSASTRIVVHVNPPTPAVQSHAPDKNRAGPIRGDTDAIRLAPWQA